MKLRGRELIAMHQEEPTSCMPKEGERGIPLFSRETSEHPCSPPRARLNRNDKERKNNNKNSNNSSNNSNNNNNNSSQPFAVPGHPPQREW